MRNAMQYQSDTTKPADQMAVLYHHRTQGRGVEAVHILSVVDGLRAEGHTCVIASPPGADPETGLATASNDAESSAQEQRGPWHVVSEYLPQIMFECLEIAYNARAFMHLRAMMRGRSIDVFYERYALFLFAGARMMARRGIPVVIEVNDSAFVRRVRPLRLVRLARWIERVVFREADALIVVTAAFGRILTGHGADASRIHVIQNTADSRVFRPETTPADVPWPGARKGFTVVGFLGKAVPWHGVDHLLNVCLELMSRRDDLRLLIVGDTSGHPELEQIAAASSFGARVHFTGQVPHEEAPAFVAAMDIAVMPNSNDFGSPVKLFEYMAMAKAIVAPRLEPVAEILEHGREALLVEPMHDVELAGALESLVDDEGLRKRLGAAARERFLQEFSPEAHRKKTLAVIEQARRRRQRLASG